MTPRLGKKAFAGLWLTRRIVLCTPAKVLAVPSLNTHLHGLVPF